MKKSLGGKTIIVPAPVWCVCTYDRNEKPNIMTIAWGGICCSEPPCVTVSLREATYTYGNIMERQAFTLCVPSKEYAQEADYYGIVSGRKKDKFKETGLNPVKSDVVDAPYVAEFPMILECKVIHHYKIGLHTHFVGEILDVKVDVDMLNKDGRVDIEKIRPVVFSPDVAGYYTIGEYVGRAFDMGRRK